MAKGFFTQGACLLTDGTTTLDAVRAALLRGGFEVVKQTPPQEERKHICSPSLLVSFAPEVNGYVAVDVVMVPWPDSMGDPKSDSQIFGDWVLGFFGPLAYPGNLARAKDHAWAWQEGRAISQRHRAFIRLLISYVFGANHDAKVMPPNYDPVAEWNFLSEMTLALLEAPGVICYFNPNGEVLMDRATFRELWDAGQEQQKLPLQLWTNVRLFDLDARLTLMDTLGNMQFEIRDVEAIFPKAEYDPGYVHYYLLNVSHYLLGLDRELKTGDNIDGPGESNLSWTIEAAPEGTVFPPRRVYRLFPKTSAAAVRAALSALKSS